MKKKNKKIDLTLRGEPSQKIINQLKAENGWDKNFGSYDQQMQHDIKTLVLVDLRRGGYDIDNLKREWGWTR